MLVLGAVGFRAACFIQRLYAYLGLHCQSEGYCRHDMVLIDCLSPSLKRHGNRSSNSPPTFTGAGH